MEDREGFEEKMAALLAEWAVKIEFMADRARVIAPEKRAAYDGFVAAMRLRYGDAARALADLKSGRNAGPGAQASIDILWKHMTNAYEKALCQFEGVHN